MQCIGDKQKSLVCNLMCDWDRPCVNFKDLLIYGIFDQFAAIVDGGVTRLHGKRQCVHKNEKRRSDMYIILKECDAY